MRNDLVSFDCTLGVIVTLQDDYYCSITSDITDAVTEPVLLVLPWWWSVFSALTNWVEHLLRALVWWLSPRSSPTAPVHHAVVHSTARTPYCGVVLLDDAGDGDGMMLPGLPHCNSVPPPQAMEKNYFLCCCGRWCCCCCCWRWYCDCNWMQP